MKKYFFCFGLFFLSYVFCQENNEFIKPEFQIDFIEKEPNIDGEVKNESLWSNILPITKLLSLIHI